MLLVEEEEAKDGDEDVVEKVEKEEEGSRVTLYPSVHSVGKGLCRIRLLLRKEGASRGGRRHPFRPVLRLVVSGTLRCV